jgi:hypothetical protein
MQYFRRTQTLMAQINFQLGLGGFIIASVRYPFFQIVMTNFQCNGRIRKDGLGIKLMMDRGNLGRVWERPR